MSANPPPAPVSPPFSFRGWLFSVWRVRNKGAVKMLLVVFLAWLTALFAAVEPPELKALLVGAVGFVSKFGLDLLDYWLTPQPEKPDPNAFGAAAAAVAPAGPKPGP